jgi:two-component system, LytTR family, sensor kinase
MTPFWKYVFPAIFGILIYTTIRLVNDLTAQERFWERPFATNAIEIIFVIMSSYIIQFMVNYFIRKFSADKSKPITGRNILREFGTIYGSVFIIVNLTIIPMAALTDDGLGLNDFVIAHIIPGLYVLLYFAIVRGNIYLQEYVDQKLKTEKIANDHLQTELKFLRAQYHPHFLFNALNTIYFQMDENVDAAKKSVEKFSELLRYQLYDQQQMVTVSQELEYLKTYIDLQRLRTSEKLKLTVELDESLGNQEVYPLLFLPLVENAFKYVGGDYFISIHATRQADNIEFVVENATPANIPAKKTPGIGLENLRRRLELLYPGKHEFIVANKPGRFSASLKLQTR